MTLHRWLPLVAVLALTTLGAPSARAETTVILPRPGQIGIGVQGQYGTLLQSGDFGEAFGSGPGLAVRLRYRMRYERGFGISFESHSFDVRTRADSAFAPDRATFILSGAEFYQIFSTRQKVQPMISVGAGIAQIHTTLNDGETAYPLGGDGLYVSGGLGMERFVYRTLALDFSTRYMAVFQNGNVNHDFQASAGLIFYASY
jgi:hypothetical protein